MGVIAWMLRVVILDRVARVLAAPCRGWMKPVSFRQYNQFLPYQRCRSFEPGALAWLWNRRELGSCPA